MLFWKTPAKTVFCGPISPCDKNCRDLAGLQHQSSLQRSENYVLIWDRWCRASLFEPIWLIIGCFDLHTVVSGFVT